MIKQLRTSYASRYGVPVLTAVDTDIFQLKYFTHCMQCTFCNDWCCSFGVDVDMHNVQRIEQQSHELEQYLGIAKSQWLDGTYEEDAEFPGGGSTRTQVVNDRCVFLNTAGRGCLLHSFSVEKGADYHDLKPMICCLFPLSFDAGVLIPGYEVEEKTLVCMGTGDSLYRGVRDEVLYYFGEGFVRELDEIERELAVVQESV